MRHVRRTLSIATLIYVVAMLPPTIAGITMAIIVTAYGLAVYLLVAA